MQMLDSAETCNLLSHCTRKAENDIKTQHLQFRYFSHQFPQQARCHPPPMSPGGLQS